MNILSSDEIFILKIIKEQYDREKRNPMASIEPKFDIEIKKDVVKDLQDKGYLVVSKQDLGKGAELITTTLTNKFFEYFGINITE